MARANPAHTAVQKAIFSGALTRPKFCTRCGGTQVHGKSLHAHHEDYAKPLDVTWLCPSFHNLRHRSLKGLTFEAFMRFDPLPSEAAA